MKKSVLSHLYYTTIFLKDMILDSVDRFDFIFVKMQIA